MKKIVFLLIPLLIPVLFILISPIDFKDPLKWVGVLWFVWWILEIILFFKIWGATNDIDKLKSAICDGKKGNDMSSYLKKMYLLGKEDEAYNYLNETLSDEIVKLFLTYQNKCDVDGLVSDEYELDMVAVDLKFNEEKDDIIEEYSYYYKSIGKEIPSRFKEIDFNTLENI